MILITAICCLYLIGSMLLINRQGAVSLFRHTRPQKFARNFKRLVSDHHHGLETALSVVFFGPAFLTGWVLLLIGGSLKIGKR